MMWPQKLKSAIPRRISHDQDQKDVKLSDFRGKSNVVLAFYPLDWSPVCQGENKCLTDDFPKFQSAHAELFGISCDSFFLPQSLGGFPRLEASPPLRLQSGSREKYGLYFEPLNCGKRATVIVDKNGKVAYEGARNQGGAEDKDILAALAKLS